MKWIHLLLLACWLIPCMPAVAQEDYESDNEEQTFRFIYIAPDNSMKMDELISDITSVFNSIVDDPQQPCIFYLANGEDPVIVKCNMPGHNEEDFENRLIYMLTDNPTYSFYAKYDRTRIYELVGENDFLNSDGSVKNPIELTFHVGRQFWGEENGEKIIAAIFFQFNGARYAGEGIMKFNVVFRCQPNLRNYDSSKTFGDSNLDKLSDYISFRVVN